MIGVYGAILVGWLVLCKSVVSNVSGLQPHASLQHGKLWHGFDNMTVVKHKVALSMTTNGLII